MKSQGLAHLIGSVLLEDHVDTGQELAADGAHGDAVGLAGLDLPLEVLLEVRVKTAGGGGCQPEGTAQVGRAARPAGPQSALNLAARRSLVLYS